MIDTFEFSILGKNASLEINENDRHSVIIFDNVTISDLSGEIGFWSSFHKKHKSKLFGAAFNAAVKKHARADIEQAIVQFIQGVKNEAI